MKEEFKQKLKEQIGEPLLRLPKDSQQAIESLDWLAKIEEIGKANGLEDENIENLAIETALVISAVNPSNEYIDNIEDEIGLTKDEAEKIAGEAMEKIFKPIAQKREEIIKEKLKNRKPNWTEDMQFVLSGGNYAYYGDKPMAEAVRAGLSDKTEQIKITTVQDKYRMPI